MRSTFIVSLILLVSAWSVAQQGTTSPSAPTSQSQSQAQDQSQTPSQSQPGTAAGQAATPNAASTDEAAASDVVEGCLGGSNPNFTVTDKSGTTYSLLIPAGADASALNSHVGESVKVRGTLDNGSANSAAGSTGSVAGSENGSAASPSQGSTPGSSQSSAAATKGIHAVKISRGTTTCSASGTSAPTPPPSKK